MRGALIAVLCRLTRRYDLVGAAAGRRPHAAIITCDITATVGSPRNASASPALRYLGRHPGDHSGNVISWSFNGSWFVWSPASAPASIGAAAPSHSGASLVTTPLPTKDVKA